MKDVYDKSMASANDSRKKNGSYAQIIGISGGS